jgi:hypothetical protein
LLSYLDCLRLLANLQIIKGIEFLTSIDVTNGDKHNSLARIARFRSRCIPTLKASNTTVVARLQRAVIVIPTFLAMLARLYCSSFSMTRINFQALKIALQEPVLSLLFSVA